MSAVLAPGRTPYAVDSIPDRAVRYLFAVPDDQPAKSSELSKALGVKGDTLLACMTRPRAAGHVIAALGQQGKTGGLHWRLSPLMRAQLAGEDVESEAADGPWPHQRIVKAADCPAVPHERDAITSAFYGMARVNADLASEREEEAPSDTAVRHAALSRWHADVKPTEYTAEQPLHVPVFVAPPRTPPAAAEVAPAMRCRMTIEGTAHQLARVAAFVAAMREVV